jgi:PAS domain S-box-containing protein
MVSAEVTAVVEALPEPAFVVGREKRLLEMNSAASAFVGIARDAARGRPCAEILRCDLCGPRCPLDDVVESGATTTSTVALESVHGATHVTLHTVPLRSPDGDVVGVVEHVRPVESSRALPERNEPSPRERVRLQGILDSLADGLFTVDSERIVTSVNRTAEQILGLPESQIVGRPCWEVLACAAGSARACPAIGAVFADGRRITNFETEYQDRAGRPLPVSLGIAPLERGGQIDGAVESFRDLRAHAAAPSSDVALVLGNPRMRRVMELVDVLKDSDATVLLQGESGTGKGVVAALIHRLGNRAHKPFVKVNCGALPESLLESELFGHVKGAFTGAVRDTVGRFELADGGTIFLDEVGELSLATQVKLLRVLQEQELERVGSGRTLHVDVRVIAATNRDLAQLMAEGRFRPDLYYRLNVIPIELPPLRDRREDIPALVEHILARLAGKGRKVKAVTPQVMDALLEHVWPGNIRELENTLEHAVVCSKGSVIELSALPRSVVVRPDDLAPRRPPPRGDAQLLDALASHRGNRAAAARALGVNRTTVWRRLKRLGGDAAPRR